MPIITNINHMKTLICSLIVLIASFTSLSAKAYNYEKFTYNIKAEIKGLSKGDIISFEKVHFPWLNTETVFKIVVKEDGEFSYEGTAFHSQYFLMTYKPVSGEKIVSDKDGLYVYIDNSGDILIKGDAKDIYSCMIEGGVYDNTKEHTQLLDIMSTLNTVIYAPLEELENFYAGLDEKARKSYYGIVLRQEIDNVSMLAPGNDAPFFILNTPDEQQISSNDYSGNYVLIYKFGLIEGSVMLDKEVIAFYKSNKDKVRVVGITEDMAAIRRFYEKIVSTKELDDTNIKPALEGMLSHPWTDVEQIGDNAQVVMDYLICGYPFFVLISPDGKILTRGFHDAFYEAQKILKESAE